MAWCCIITIRRISHFPLLMNYSWYCFWQHEGVNSAQSLELYHSLIEKGNCVLGKKLTAPLPHPCAHANNSPASWNFLSLWNLAQGSSLEPQDPSILPCHVLSSDSYTEPSSTQDILMSFPPLLSHLSKLWILTGSGNLKIHFCGIRLILVPCTPAHKKLNTAIDGFRSRNAFMFYDYLRVKILVSSNDKREQNL